MINKPQSQKPTSLQDIIRRRASVEFVGREDQLALFQRNLAIPVDDEQRRFILNIFGQGGVGKTRLLERFQHLTQSAGALYARIDESVDAVPAAMALWSAQLKQQGHPLKTFDARYTVYRQKREELEASPDAPQGFTAFAARTLTKVTTSAVKTYVPGAGLVLEHIDQDAFATQVSEWADFVRRRLTNKDEVRLVLEPVPTLTPLFLDDLRALAEDHTLVLAADTYERTDAFLDAWLRDLLAGAHGDLPPDIILVLAGRSELDRNHWSTYAAITARLPLDPFTEQETRDYLARKQITNPDVIEVIWQLSGGLPLLVATLAAESPDDPARIGDVSGTAVERFLSWVDDPLQRQLAVDAALPLRFNQDIVALLVEEDAPGHFAWLRTNPFVTRLAADQGWAYHDVVRRQMLLHKRRASPDDWTKLHTILADYFAAHSESLGLELKAGIRNAAWQELKLAELFHRLCANPVQYLPTALNGFLDMLKEHRSFAERWASILETAGEDVQAKGLKQWGQQLAVGLQAVADNNNVTATEMFTALINSGQLTTDRMRIVWAWRGEMYRLSGRDEAALADFISIVDLDPNDGWGFAKLGLTYSQLGRLKESLANFDRAIEIEPKYAIAMNYRGWTNLKMHRYKQALVDFNAALELRLKDDVIYYGRSLTHSLLNNPTQSQADIQQAITLAAQTHTQDPQDWGNTFNLALYHLAAGNHQQAEHLYHTALQGDAPQSNTREAITDLDDCLTLFPTNAHAQALRDLLHQHLEP